MTSQDTIPSGDRYNVCPVSFCRHPAAAITANPMIPRRFLMVFSPLRVETASVGQTERGKVRPVERASTVDLLAQAKQGSDAALGLLYERCAGQLLAYIRLRMGRDLRARLESRDILQSTLLKSLTDLHELKGEQSESLMALAGADRRERDPRPRRLPPAAAPRRGARASRSRTSRRCRRRRAQALTQVILNEEIIRLEARARNAVAGAQREIIVLRKFEELTFPEIATRLGKSEDACRMAVRARDDRADARACGAPVGDRCASMTDESRARTSPRVVRRAPRPPRDELPVDDAVRQAGPTWSARSRDSSSSYLSLTVSLDGGLAAALPRRGSGTTRSSAPLAPRSTASGRSNASAPAAWARSTSCGPAPRTASSPAR